MMCVRVMLVHVAVWMFGSAKGDLYSFEKSCFRGKESIIQVTRGRRACKTCSAGHFYVDPKNMTSKGNCLKCFAGYYNREKFGHTNEQCEVCEAGTFSSLPGSTACTECREGKFTASSGQTACKFCAPGEFSAGLKASTCHKCPARHIASKPGQASCQSCQQGKYTPADTPSTACVVCPADSLDPACVRSGSGPVHFGVLAVLIVIAGTHFLNQRGQRRRTTAVPTQLQAFTCHDRGNNIRAVEISNFPSLFKHWGEVEARALHFLETKENQKNSSKKRLFVCLTHFSGHTHPCIWRGNSYAAQSHPGEFSFGTFASARDVSLYAAVNGSLYLPGCYVLRLCIRSPSSTLSPSFYDTVLAESKPLWVLSAQRQVAERNSMCVVGRLGSKAMVAVGTTFAAGLGPGGLASIEGTDVTENYFVPTKPARALEHLRTQHVNRVLVFVDRNDTELLNELAITRQIASETYCIEYRVWQVDTMADPPARKAFVEAVRDHAKKSFRGIFGANSRGKILLCARPFCQDVEQGVLHYSRVPLVAAVALATGDSSSLSPGDSSDMTGEQAYERVQGAVGSAMPPSQLSGFREVLGVPLKQETKSSEESKSDSGEEDAVTDPTAPATPEQKASDHLPISRLSSPKQFSSSPTMVVRSIVRHTAPARRLMTPHTSTTPTTPAHTPAPESEEPAPDFEDVAVMIREEHLAAIRTTALGQVPDLFRIFQLLLTPNPIDSAPGCRRYFHWCQALSKLAEKEGSSWVFVKDRLRLTRRLHHAIERTTMVQSGPKEGALELLSKLIQKFNIEMQTLQTDKLHQAKLKLQSAKDKLRRHMENPDAPKQEDPRLAMARLRKYIEGKTREFANKAKHKYSAFLTSKKLTWGDKGTRWRTWDPSKCSFGLVSARNGEWSFEMAVKELQGRDQGEHIIVDEFLQDYEREHSILYDMCHAVLQNEAVLTGSKGLVFTNKFLDDSDPAFPKSDAGFFVLAALGQLAVYDHEKYFSQPSAFGSRSMQIYEFIVVYLNVAAVTATKYAQRGLKIASFLAAVRSRYLFQTWVHHFGNAALRKRIETELFTEWKMLQRTHNQPSNGSEPIEPENVLPGTQKIIMMIEIAGALLRRFHSTFDNEVKAFAQSFVIDEDCGGWTGYLSRLCGIASPQDIANRREEEEDKYRDCYYARLGVQSQHKGWQGTAWEKFGNPRNTSKFRCNRYWEFGAASRGARARLPKPASWQPPSSSSAAASSSNVDQKQQTVAPTPLHPSNPNSAPTLPAPLPGSASYASSSANQVLETEDGSIPKQTMLSSWQLTN